MIAAPATAAGLSLAAALRERSAGRLTAAAWMEGCIARIEEREAAVKAWAFLDRHRALDRARAMDRAGGRSPLAGMPLGVKDVIDVAGLPTGCQSPLEDGRIAGRSATAVERLEAAGAIVLGKTVTTEYAFTAPGPTVNPHDAARTPGGSSQGSAAAVADFHAPSALATQTGGSAIRPAAFCGVVGYKGAYGWTPGDGLKYLAPSLDTIGVHARSVEDARIVADVLEARDRPRALPRYRFTRLRAPEWDRCDPSTLAMLDAASALLESAGARVAATSAPAALHPLDAAHRVVMSVEVARTFSDLRPEARTRLSESLAAFIARGRGESGERLADAQAAIARARAALTPFAGRGDMFIGPAALGEAPEGLAATGDSSLNRMWSLLHVAVLTLPCGLGPHGLPLGLQIVDPHPAGLRLFAAAAFAETALAPLRHSRFGGRP